MNDQNQQNLPKDNTPSWKIYLYVIITFSIFFGIFKGCLSEFTGGSFTNSFIEQTGWILSVGIIVVVIIFMAVIGAIFSGKNNKRY